MAMEGYLHFPKAPALWEPHSQIVVLYPGHSLGESYYSAEMQSVYCTASRLDQFTYEVIFFYCIDGVHSFFIKCRLQEITPEESVGFHINQPTNQPSNC